MNSDCMFIPWSDSLFRAIILCHIKLTNNNLDQNGHVSGIYIATLDIYQALLWKANFSWTVIFPSNCNKLGFLSVTHPATSKLQIAFLENWEDLSSQKVDIIYLQVQEN